MVVQVKKAPRKYPAPRSIHVINFDEVMADSFRFCGLSVTGKKLSRAAHVRAMAGGCPTCGDFFVTPKSEDWFLTDAGYGLSYKVWNTSGLCPRCWNEWRSLKVESSPVSEKKEYYRLLTTSKSLPYTVETIAYIDGDE